MAGLGRVELVALLTELGQLLAQRRVQGDLMVVGGAVMALAYNTGRLTTDIGGIFEPKAVIYESDRCRQ